TRVRYNARPRPGPSPAGRGVGVRGNGSPGGSSVMTPFAPHPALRATFSRREKGNHLPEGIPMTANDTWFIEHFEHTGSAIGFRVTGKLDEVHSPFQKIEIYDSTDWGKLMVIDGAMMLTTRDNFFYHEMISHPVLFTH